MDQEAFEIAVKGELEDLFEYYRPSGLSLVGACHRTEEEMQRISEEPLITSRVYFFLITGFIFIVVLCLLLYFIPETKTEAIIIGILELVIIIDIIGVGLVVLYKKIKKIIEERRSIMMRKQIFSKLFFDDPKLVKAMEEYREKRRQRLLEILRDINTKLYKDSVNKDLIEIEVILKNYSTQEASNLLAKEDIRKRICPALKSATDDVFDISKAVTPVLVGCVVAGTISIPLNPVLFAAVAVVIARVGISALCVGFITK